MQSSVRLLILPLTWALPTIAFCMPSTMLRHDEYSHDRSTIQKY